MVMMDPGYAWIKLLVLAIPVVLFGVLLAAAITLIAIPATRKAGWILLALFVGAPLVLIPVAGFIWFDRGVFVPLHQDGIMQSQTVHNELTRKAEAAGIPISPGSSRVIEHSPATGPTSPLEAPATPPAEKQPLDKALTAESARLIDVLSKVLAKTIVEDPKAWQDLAAKAAKRMEQPAEKKPPNAEAPLENPTKPTLDASSAPPIPAWVGQSWHGVGDGAVYERDVELDPYPSRLDAEMKLPEAVQKAIDEFVEIAFADPQVKVKLPPEELRRLVKDYYEEWRTISLGNMLTLHARTKIDKNTIEQAYRQARAEFAAIEQRAAADRHVWRFGLNFTGGILFLAACWGYLKIDLATGGNHRRILRTAVLIVILSIAAAVAIAAMA